MKTKPHAVLSEWMFDDSVPFPRLIGIVRDHAARPDLLDGESIYTSRLLRIDFEANTAETLNTIYHLLNRAA